MIVTLTIHCYDSLLRRSVNVWRLHDSSLLFFRRVVELLTHNWTLSKRMRVPAISRLQVSGHQGRVECQHNLLHFQSFIEYIQVHIVFRAVVISLFVLY